MTQLAESPRTDYAARNTIPLDLIDLSPFNPREHFDPVKLQLLADNIRLFGVMQPILVRPVGTRFEIMAGERRYRACKLIEEDTIPAIVQECADADALDMAIAENFHREDLNPMELARGVSKLVEFGMTQAAIGDRLGRQQGDISKLLGLLRLPGNVRMMISQGWLSQTHGVYLCALLEWPDALESLAETASNEKWTTDRLKGAVDGKKTLLEAARGQQSMFESGARAAEKAKAEKQSSALVGGFMGPDDMPAREQIAVPVCPNCGSINNARSGALMRETPDGPALVPPPELRRCADCRATFRTDGVPFDAVAHSKQWEKPEATPEESQAAAPAAPTVTVTDRVTETHTTTTTPGGNRTDGTDRTNTSPTPPPAAPRAAATEPVASPTMVSHLIPEALDDWLFDQEMSVIEALELLRRMLTALESAGRGGGLAALADELDNMEAV